MGHGSPVRSLWAAPSCASEAAVRRSDTECHLRIVDTSSRYPRGIVGLVDNAGSSVTPLQFPSAAPISELYDLIENWDEASNALQPAGPAEQMSQVKIQAPFRGRDILAIGKNYKAHAK